MSRARTIIALCGLTMIACLGGRPPRAVRAAPAPRSVGRVDSFQVAMPELGDRRRRTVRVYLPGGYESAGRAFPVLYLQDAQQLFSPGPFGDWKVDETLDTLGGGAFGGVIVVGVDNGDRRWDEYGPWVNHQMFDWVDSTWSRRTEGGEGTSYVRFLANTLKPLIDSRYRTLADRAHTGVGGSSMGGLIALYAGLTRPDVFSKVMAMSTAVWFAEDGGAWLSGNRLLADLRGRHAALRDVRFYLDVGTEERSRATEPDVVDADGRRLTYARAYVEGSRAVAAALVESGVPPRNLALVVDSGAAHDESAWSRRFPGAVRWLYQ